MYKDGYDAGFDDAINGKSKDARRHLSSLFKAATRLFSSDYATEQFFQGYNEGYRKGSERRHN